ncbi:hypothetical protein K474DRAFT_1771218 [Panus rudis PR-1116 ss-1]|nr:hypothetical protein K474DRAFT_1771218 [Panus rudis PR-1116 ss-1]
MAAHFSAPALHTVESNFSTSSQETLTESYSYTSNTTEERHYSSATKEESYSSTSSNATDIIALRSIEKFRLWMPAAVEPQPERARTLILCFDGTGDQFDSDNSNVVQLVSLLKKDDSTKQLVYYQTGIGTYADPVLKTPLFESVSLVLDQMFASNLSSHIKAGYEFLMQNYTAGDKICIFGFSRGAYTARALAGMLQKVGLLPAHNHQQIPFAYDMYKREDLEGLHLSAMFKYTFCRDVSVEFLGVWDTVASVGLVPRYLPFITENNGIKYLRHALALDERRIKFLPSYCVDSVKKMEKQKAKEGKKKEHVAKQYEDAINEYSDHVTDVKEVWFAGVHTDVGGGSVRNDTPNTLARIPLRWMIRECFRCNTGIIFDAVMLHQLGLNVYLGNEGRPVLGEQPARLPLTDPDSTVKARKKPSILWTVMVGLWGLLTYPFTAIGSFLRNLFAYPAHGNTGLHVVSPKLLYDRYMSAYNLLRQISPKEAALREAEEERKDVQSEINDQLDLVWAWHVLEWLPMRVKKQKAIVGGNVTGGYKWMWNKGQGRKIFKDEMEEGLKVHRSVKTRLEAGDALYNGLYIPKVRPNLPKTKEEKAKSKDDKPKAKKAKVEPVMLTYDEWNVENPVHWDWVD